MATDAMTLREYGEQLIELADEWEGEENPLVLIGDVTGNISVNAKDGHTKLGDVGFAQELFDGNGVMELGDADWRFYGAVMLSPSDLGAEAAEKIQEVEYEGIPS